MQGGVRDQCAELILNRAEIVTNVADVREFTLPELLQVRRQMRHQLLAKLRIEKQWCDAEDSLRRPVQKRENVVTQVMFGSRPRPWPQFLQRGHEFARDGLGNRLVIPSGTGSTHADRRSIRAERDAPSFAGWAEYAIEGA